MIEVDSFPRISHSDFDTQIGKSLKSNRLMETYTRKAIANTAKNIGVGKDAVEFGQRIASVTKDEEKRRRALNARYRSMIDMPWSEHIVSEVTDTIVEDTLVDFEERASGLSHQTSQTVWQEVSKGVSGELAYIEQLGDWSQAHDLDEQVRLLKTSQGLAQAGMVLTHIHERDDAKIGYSLRLVYRDETPDTPVSLLAIRKRAVANVQASNGENIEIVRRSGFLVNPRNLSQDSLINVMAIGSTKDKKRKKDLMQKFGEEIVEPYVQDDSLRQDSTIFPVTSLYFALDRHPRHDN